MAVLSQYTIKRGDTLQIIAQTLLGDANAWMRIALLNDMDYPFISDNIESNPKIKRFGTVILIPSIVDDTETVETLLVDPYSQLLGVDLSLANGEFDVDINGDLALVSGIDCLYQDLMHRLGTEYGSVPYHPTYGSRFNTVVGNKSNKHWLDKATVELTRTFKSDPRVSDVKDVQVLLINDQIHIKCTVVTINGSIPIQSII